MDSPMAIINKVIRGTHPREKFFPSVGAAGFYADTMTIDSFNSLLSIHISLLREKYDYAEAEHEDWVSSDKNLSQYTVVDEAYKEKQENKRKQEIRLLDSWTLRMPISFVPSEDEIKEEMYWRKSNKVLFANLLPQANTIEILQDCYIFAACFDVRSHDTLLEKWTSLGRPLSQEVASTIDGVDFLKQKVQEQRCNVEVSTLALRGLCNWDAPQFLLDRASGRLCLEEKIHAQIKYAIRLYK